MSEQQTRKAGPLTRLVDLLMGRIHNRIFEMMQKDKELAMSIRDVESRLQATGQRLATDMGGIKGDLETIKAGIQELRTKAETEGVDLSALEDELTAIEAAATSADESASGLHSVAQTFISGEVLQSGPPSDVTGISPTGAGQGTGASSPAGGGVGLAGGAGQPIDAEPVDDEAEEDAEDEDEEDEEDEDD